MIIKNLYDIVNTLECRCLAPLLFIAGAEFVVLSTMAPIAIFLDEPPAEFTGAQYC